MTERRDAPDRATEPDRAADRIPLPARDRPEGDEQTGGLDALAEPRPVDAAPAPDRAGRGRRCSRRRATTGDRSVVVTAGLLLVVLTAGAYLPSPLYPDYQRLFGYDDLVMTSLFATFALVSGPALLLCGPAADLLGPRPLLRLAVGSAAVGSCCFALATSPGLLFAGRGAQGLALGAATGAAQALVIRHRGPTARLGGPLLASLAFVVGTALGPVVGGTLGQYGPAPLVTPFVLHLVLLGWLWTRVSRTVPATRPGVTGAPVSARRWRPVRPHIPRAAWGVFAVGGLHGFLAWAVVGIYLALVPALLGADGGEQNLAVTGAVLGTVLVWSLLAQLLGARRGPRAAQRLGAAALTGSLLVLAAFGTGSLGGTVVAACLAGVGHGLAFSGAVRAVDARTPPEHRAGVGAALHLLCYLGSAAPAIAVGLLTVRMSLTAAVTALSWVAVGLGLLALLATARGAGGPRRAERGAARTVRRGGPTTPRPARRAGPVPPTSGGPPGRE